MLSILIIMETNESRGAWDEDWTEAQIVLMGQGNGEALERLYLRTHSAVYAFLLSVLKNQCDAEDALQDTYVGIFQASGSYRADGHSKAWIFTIARNQAMMRFRERKRFVGDGEAILELYPDSDHSQRAQDRLLLETALRTLTNEDCQIVLLHAAAGFKHRETARLLGLPLNTVLSKYHRALKQLKQTLKEGKADA